MSEIVVTEGFEFRDSSRREVARIEIPCWCFPEESRLVVVAGTAVENGREFNWIDCSVRGRRPQPASVDLGPDGLHVRTNPPLPKLSPGEVRSALLRGVAQYYETQPWEPSLAETRLAEKVGIRFQRRYKDGGSDRPDEAYWMAWYGSAPGVGVFVGCWDDVVKFAQSQGLEI